MAQKFCLALDLTQFLSNVPENLGLCMTLVLYAKVIFDFEYNSRINSGSPTFARYR